MTANVNGDRKRDLVVANYTTPGTAAVLVNTTALTLSFNGDTLFITPPPASTFGVATNCTIHYNTPTRIAAGQPWSIWAKSWPANQLAIDLAAAQTIAGCRSVGAPTAWCYRPSLVGEHGPGQTYVYRLFANSGVGWSPVSPSLSVTRPSGPIP